MNRKRMWAGILAVFACGLVIGGIGGSLYERQLAVKRYAHIHRDKGAFLAKVVLDRLDDTLGLSAGQKAAIKPLLLAGFRRSLKVREEVRPRQDRIMQQTTEEIRRLLTPAQAAKLRQSGEWQLLLPKHRKHKR